MGCSSVTEASAAPCVTVSVVSHGQSALVDVLLADLARCPEVVRVVLTHNIPEPAFNVPEFLAGRVDVLRNDAPKGFGVNHNAALRAARSEYVCILNPDIRFAENPFPALLECLRETSASLVAPRVLSPAGSLEDSARYFPTPGRLARKALWGDEGRFPVDEGAPSEPDWLAGMCMVLRTEAFQASGGFDEGYFLYYEDVDLCARLRAGGRSLAWCPRAAVIHDARRASRQKLRYMLWHARGMLRFFLKFHGCPPGAGGH